MIAQISQVMAFYYTSDATLLFYADPGSGALIIQMLLAVAFGGLFYFRRFKDKIFGGKKQSDTQIEDSAEIPKVNSEK